VSSTPSSPAAITPSPELTRAAAGARGAWRRGLALAVILAVTVVRFGHDAVRPDWDEHWALRQAMIGVAFALATAWVAWRWVPSVLLGQFGVLVWGFGFAYALGFRAAGDPVVYTPTLRSCQVHPATRLYGCPVQSSPMDLSQRSWAVREAWWYTSQLVAYIWGPPAGAYTGPLFTEAEAIVLAKQTTPVSLSVAGVVALFDDPDLAGAAWFDVDHWRDAERLGVTHVGDDGVLLSWDDGETIDLYDRRTARLVQTWSPGRAPEPRPEIGEAPSGPRTLADVTQQREIERRIGQRAPANNALWLRRRWLHELRTTAEIEALVHQLHSHEITTIYPFIGPMRPDGRFGWRDGDVLREYDPETARAFFTHAHAAAAADGSGLPLMILPWTGGVLNRDVHLEDPAWRAAFVAQATALVALGADGIQVNIEPMSEDTDGYLALLAELRVSLGASAILGVAAYPPPTPLHPYADVHWSLDFYRAVCASADDVAVMAYDTALPTATAYTALVRQWTDELGATLPPASDPAGCTWRMGVPDYDDDAPWHRPEAETLRAALDGVTEGAADDTTLPNGRRPDGVAIYASWTTDPVEWATFDLRWLRAAPYNVEWIDGP
jgi:hypothetical protein